MPPPTPDLVDDGRVREDVDEAQVRWRGLGGGAHELRRFGRARRERLGRRVYMMRSRERHDD